MDKHDLYERTVQDPPRMVSFLLAVHGGDPTVLGEDFCGTAALSRAWVHRVAHGRAIAVDHDPLVVERARGDARIEVLLGDVRTATTSAAHAADVVLAGNFSIGELHARAELLRYLRHSRARLRPGGVFACDTYGGSSAYSKGALRRDRFLEGGVCVRATWEHCSADPATGMVENALHFRVERDGEVFQEITDAFRYRWRLWSLPELRDALFEVGFESVRIYDSLTDERPSEDAIRPAELHEAELGPSFVVCVAAR